MAMCIGVMSGTSMDGVDAVLAEIRDDGVQVLHEHSEPIPADLKRRLEQALLTDGLLALEAWRLDAAVGSLFARTVLGLLEVAGVAAARIVAIGSHGQTLYHAPGEAPPLSIQIGDPNIIASRTGITTVADFRRMDVAMGGQGAPLAPAFHAFAFSDDARPRAVLNLGGIANLSALPPRGEGAVLGFDIGPGNTLMDVWSAQMRGLAFDQDGAWAGTGHVHEPLLRDLLAEPYFARPPPKSTGRELFNARWLGARLRRHGGVAPESVQRTLCQLTAVSAATAVRAHAPLARELFVCGGGAHNPVLMAALEGELPDCEVCSTQRLGVPPKAVEGAAFAWLAHERLQGRSAVHGSVTGAARAPLLGGVYRAD